MRNTVEFKRKISLLLILAMLISGQAGLTVNVWAADVAGEYTEIPEEDILDDIGEAEKLTDELSEGSGDISDIDTGDELQAETVSVNNEDAVDLLFRSADGYVFREYLVDEIGPAGACP